MVLPKTPRSDAQEAGCNMAQLPIGFHISGIQAGLKRSGKHDLGAIWSDEPLAWALTTTSNLVRAISVDRNRELAAQDEKIRAVIVNSGNANCATGAEGAANNQRMAAAFAGALGVEASEVITASTGVIGQQMPIDALEAAVPTLVANPGPLENFAKAILTTDLTQKVATRTLSNGAVITGVTKGSGMIHPNMATMLAFVLTDADLAQDDLRAIWREAVDQSFNQITVDGDESTNDMAVLLSSQKLNVNRAEFIAAVNEVTADLAKQIAADGEGATKLMTITVTGAASVAEARAAARTIAGSSLVKTAVHGADPNWGRILAAAGRSGAQFAQEHAVVTLQGTEIYRGTPLAFDQAALSEKLNAADVAIEVDLHAGDATATAWGCDLSSDYVRINADYTT